MMKIIFLISCTLVISSISWAEEKKEVKNTPADTSFVFIANEKAKNEKILSRGNICLFLPGIFLSNSKYSDDFLLIASPENAIPEKAKFYLEITPKSAAIKKRKENYTEEVWRNTIEGQKQIKVYKTKTIEYNVFTCKYKFNESNNGKWNSSKSGNITIAEGNLSPMRYFFSGLIYKNYFKVTVNKTFFLENKSKLKISGKVKNTSSLTANNIYINTAYKIDDVLNYCHNQLVTSDNLKPNEEKKFTIIVNVGSLFPKFPDKRRKIWNRAHVVTANFLTETE